MADTTLYATEAEYLAYLDLTGEALTPAQSAQLVDACRAWDLLCGVEPGWFAVNTSTARLFDVTRTDSLWLGAIAEELGITIQIDKDGDRVYETTLSPTLDYYLDPVDGPPFRSILIDPVNGRYALPVGRRRVKVTAKHGWATSAPGPVRRACLLIAKRYNVRPNTPEGIASGGEHIMKLASHDPDVVAILETGLYRQGPVFA